VKKISDVQIHFVFVHSLQNFTILFLIIHVFYKNIKISVSLKGFLTFLTQFLICLKNVLSMFLNFCASEVLCSYKKSVVSLLKFLYKTKQ